MHILVLENALPSSKFLPQHLKIQTEMKYVRTLNETRFQGTEETGTTLTDAALFPQEADVITAILYISNCSVYNPVWSLELSHFPLQPYSIQA